MQRYHTLLELKEDHKILGLKGWKFFIVDFPRNLKTDELDYVIAQPQFNGAGVGAGICSWVLNNEEIEELFNVGEMNFNQYAIELEADYWEKRDEEEGLNV